MQSLIATLEPLMGAPTARDEEQQDDGNERSRKRITLGGSALLGGALLLVAGAIAAALLLSSDDPATDAPRPARTKAAERSLIKHIPSTFKDSCEASTKSFGAEFEGSTAVQRCYASDYDLTYAQFSTRRAMEAELNERREAMGSRGSIESGCVPKSSRCDSNWRDSRNRVRGRLLGEVLPDGASRLYWTYDRKPILSELALDPEEPSRNLRPALAAFVEPAAGPVP